MQTKNTFTITLFFATKNKLVSCTRYNLLDMSTPLTIQKAIRRGYAVIAYPIMALAIFLTAFFLPFGRQEPLSPILQLSVLGGSLLIGWAYWCFASAKWRIWAFEQIRNVHELKREALEARLLFSEDSFFHNIQWVSAANKQKIQALQQKFLEEDLFVDQASIPLETKIYRSKLKTMALLLLAIVAISIGLLLLLHNFFEYTTSSVIVGSMFFLFGGFFALEKYRDLQLTDPFIVVNEKGIQTISCKFKPWASIEGEELVLRGSGNHLQTYLVYRFPGGSERLRADHLTVSPKDLKNLLYVYRGRSKPLEVPANSTQPDSPEALFQKFFNEKKEN